MDPALTQVVAIFIGEMLFLPILLFLIKRFIGSKLDNFDEKRDEARKEQKAREKYRESWEAALSDGIRSLLRSEIIGEYRKAIAAGYASLETKEYVEKVHKSYTSLGGNSLGTSMFEAIIALPTKPPEHEEEHEE